ncbi:MAG: hypothetical protein ACR2M4_05020 [Actinomycetota bacterium]
MDQRMIRHLFSLLVAGTLFAACSNGSSTTTVSPSPSPALDSKAAAGTCRGFASGPKDRAPENADADGTHMAFIVSVDPSKSTMTYDVVQWLSGEEANEAHRTETGDDSRAPNDYYIVNDNSKVRTLTVTDGACIAVFETGDPASDKALPDLAGLSQFLETQRRRNPEKGPDPFRITKESDRITAIQQQWRP